MSLLLIRPGHAMAIGNNRLALYAPLPAETTSLSTGGSSSSLAQAAPGATGWWDASSPSGLIGPGGLPVTAWNSGGTALVDLSGNGQNLAPFYSPGTANPPQVAPHVSGMLGGVGYPTTNAALLRPTLDAGSGWQATGSNGYAASSWTWYLVWSRPNWRQGTAFNANPITLLTIGSIPIVQVDSQGGANRLVLFPGGQQIVVNSSMARRHTHSIVLRYSPTSGADLWLDNTQIAQSVPWSPGAISGPVLLLHDGTSFGAAQCWLHEAAAWNVALSNTQVSGLLNYAARWIRGPRKGLYFIVNGQSNAINYAINDGAAALLAQGVAWYLGALAYNVLATTGSPSNYTMQGGHGIYATSSGYPGSFVQNPSDGSPPSAWSLGADGQAVTQAVAGLQSEDLADLCAIVWPWNETDSLRQYSEYTTFQAAALRFLSLLRSMLGDQTNRIPLVWWNAIPYGSSDGMIMHRQVAQSIASNAAQNVIIGNPQTADSNPRSSVWDATTGIATGGDFAHRDSADNVRFAMLAAPVVAQALAIAGKTDSIAAIPAALPKVGGPSIVHVYMQSTTTLIVTVLHDAGNDLIVPLLGATGQGFAVMDGGTPGNDGPIVSALSCQRVDATHLQIVLHTALRNPPGACQLFYPFGSAQIGRGNAVTDNFSTITPPAGWNAGIELGTNWNINFPLSATFSGIPLSTTPS